MTLKELIAERDKYQHLINTFNDLDIESLPVRELLTNMGFIEIETHESKCTFVKTTEDGISLNLQVFQNGIASLWAVKDSCNVYWWPHTYSTEIRALLEEDFKLPSVYRVIAEYDVLAYSSAEALELFEEGECDARVVTATEVK